MSVLFPSLLEQDYILLFFFYFFVNKKIHKNIEVKLFVQIPSNLIEISVYSSYWSITTPGAK